MKPLLLSFCFLIMCHFVAAQYLAPNGTGARSQGTVVDSAYMKASYRLMSVKNPQEPEKTTFEDIQTLQIGTKVSKFFSQYLVDHLKLVAEKVAKGARAVENNPYRGSYGYEVFKNHPEQGVVTVDELGYFPRQPNYLYQEPLPQIEWKWQMQATLDTVLGYVCQKATTRFRGRDYTAWFALGLPIPLGPWKFGGLPGLILKLEDTQKHYVWECIGIERLKQKEPIEFRSAVKFSKISRADMETLFRRMHKDYVAFFVATGGKYFAMKEGKMEQVYTSHEWPYNPIELE